METNQQREWTLWAHAILAGVLVFILSAGYLWARRWGMPFGDVAYKISFAGLAVAGTFLLSLSYAMGPLARLVPRVFGNGTTLRKYYGMVGFGVIVVHVFWGLATLTPAYYPKFFHGETLTLNAMLFLMTGTLALILFLLVAVTSLKSVAQFMPKVAWRATQRLGYVALIVTLIHFGSVKYKGWADMGDWPHLPEFFGFVSFVPLPPLSFLLFLFIIFVFALRIMDSAMAKAAATPPTCSS